MRQPNRGVTLLELTVVLGIIGILVAMLLPAIQRVRETVRKTVCQENLRQTALAVQTFHSAKQRLPSLYNGSFISHPKTQWDEYHFHSWEAAILPQLEQHALYDRLDFTLPATAPSNQENVNVELSVFICPSTSNYTPTVPDLAERDPIVKVGTAARSDYEAIGGIIHDPKVGGFGSRPYDHIELGVWGPPRYEEGDVGTFKELDTTRFRDVTDGLSNTMIVGEMSGRPDTYARGKPDQPYVGDAGPVGQPAWAISGIFWTNSLSEHHGVNETNQQGLYSFHVTGANVALADGSVRLLSNSTDKKILKALATRAGGETDTLD